MMAMRKMRGILIVALSIVLFLAGCGVKKEANDVVKDLAQVLGNMKSYEASGSMLLYTGAQPLEYDVEVWYQSPHYYRIALTNTSKDITQIVLRNDEGVFILTPHLNKSIRFQSDWPSAQGQVYLYQTLLKSILDDQERLFAIDEVSSAYVFDVIAAYDNSSLARQKIWLNSKTYAPEHVEIVDEQKNVIVVVEFDHFHFGKQFEPYSFDRERNLASWLLTAHPVFASYEDEEEGNSDEFDMPNFGVIHPGYTPFGVELAEVREMSLGGERAVLLVYEGEYHYHLVEQQPQAKEVLLLPGQVVDVIDMQFTIGMLTQTDEVKQLSWVHEGIEYKLASGELPTAEMIKIAQSVQGQIGK